MSETAPHLQDTSAEDLASQIESLLGSSARPDDGGMPQDPKPPADEDLGSQVEQMLDDAIDKAHQIAQSVEADAPSVAAADSELDEELTTLAEQMSRGSNEPHAAGATPPAAPQVAEVIPVATAALAAASAPPAPAPAPPPARDAHAAPTPAMEQVHHDPPPEKQAPREGMRARSTLPGSAGRLMETVGNVLAMPLANAKPIVRDSVGWLSLVTVFMGGCMWAAVLLRDPKSYVPDVPPATLVTEGAGGHGTESGGHGAAKDEHGGSKSAKDGHAPAGGGHGAKEAHDKKDAGHGGAAPPPVKREPLIQRGAAKKPAKDAKKADAHGGGH